MGKAFGTLFRLSPGIVAAAIFAALSATSAHAARNAEQVVFSGIGGGSEPFGFWVWCQVEPSASSRGQYETDCNGAIYFYDRGIVEHVTGEVTEPSEGIYEMDVESRDGRVSCTLTNELPTLHGPHNTVGAACEVDGQQVTGLVSTSAVVNVTGP